MDRINWGILSTAKIGIEKVIPAMQKCLHGDVAGIASRSIDRAREASVKMGIPYAYGSYEELLADPVIDAIYNPLPNHLHVPLTIKALEAGKHVLCEKPIALDVREACVLRDAAAAYPQLKVMEAFMYRFHPQWQRVRELIITGALGDLKTIQTLFSYFNKDPNNIRNASDKGGGGLMDIGCYPISQARYLFDREPERIFAHIDIDPDFGVDRIASAILDFGSGTATFTCSMQMSPFQRAQVIGTTARVEIEIPVNTPADQPAKLWLSEGNDSTLEATPACDQYTVQADEFALAIINDTAVPVSLDDAVNNMRVIEAAFKSHASGGWAAITH